MNGIPIIRLEIQQMQHSIAVALSEYVVKMDKDIQHAIEQACKPENIMYIIEESAHKAIKEVISLEINDFFRYGNGRKAVRKAVNEILSQEIQE